ncbi:MAG TPA: hypothetical protein VFA37_03555 [Gaiellaceae bacterium]|nr:hypothetical protein [Gaiellaceae bacterium]
MTERFDTFSPPNEPDPFETTAPTETAEEGALDPREAAALLEASAREAERRFDMRPTILMFAAAVTVLVGYGAVWVSVRHQHPYSGPTGHGLAVLYGVLALWIVLNVVLLGRALSGRRSQERRLEGIVFASVWICVYVFQGALHHADHNPAIAYGIWPAIAPLLVVGAAAAGYEIARDRRGAAALAVGAVALAAGGAFAGPVTVWGVMGVGLCALCLIGGAAQYRQRRHG